MVIERPERIARRFNKQRLKECRDPGLNSDSTRSFIPARPPRSPAEPGLAELWQSRNSRFELLKQITQSDRPELRLVLAAVVQKVHSEKAWALSTIASHLDASMLSFLRSHGFIRGPVQWPLYLFSSEREGPPVPDLANLSYLDTDLATAF